MAITVTFTATTPDDFLTVQTATFMSDGEPIEGVAGTYYECQTAGCTKTSGGGYHTGTTNTSGQIVYDNHLPTDRGAGSIYRDWCVFTYEGVEYTTNICEVDITDSTGGGTSTCATTLEATSLMIKVTQNSG